MGFVIPQSICAYTACCIYVNTHSHTRSVPHECCSFDIVVLCWQIAMHSWQTRWHYIRCNLHVAPIKAYFAALTHIHRQTHNNLPHQSLTRQLLGRWRRPVLHESIDSAPRWSIGRPGLCSPLSQPSLMRVGRWEEEWGMRERWKEEGKDRESLWQHLQIVT